MSFPKSIIEKKFQSASAVRIRLELIKLIEAVLKEKIKDK